MQRQELALAGKISIFDITTVAVGDGCSFIQRAARRYCTVSEAMSAFGVRPLSEDDFNFMCSTFAVKYLVPVADPRSAGATWPTIVVPSDENEYPFVKTGEDEERVFEILRAWRSRIDEFASATPCSPLGWIGGIYVPHPHAGDEMVMLWPWLHRPYGPEGRPGDSQVFELFNVSVDRPWY